MKNISFQHSIAQGKFLNKALHGLGLGLCIILIVGSTLHFGRDLLRGLSIDVLQSMAFAKHDLLDNGEEPSMRSDVSLIMLDEASYQSTALANTPRVLWTPEFAEVITAVMEADSKILGLDIILPTTAANWTGNRTHDRTFMQSLAKYGRKEDRLLMGEVYLQNSALRPFKGFIHAIGGDKNIRPLNVTPDNDNIVRQIPDYVSLLSSSGEEINAPSFTLEIIKRVAGLTPPKQGIRPEKGSEKEEKRSYINYDPTRPLEVHSFSQVLGCAKAGADDYFREAFAGKVVLLGLDLAVEDRFQSSNRFSAQDNTLALADCQGTVQARGEGLFGTAGVTILANGISNKLAGTSLITSDQNTVYLIVFLISLLAMIIAVRLQSWQSFCAVLFVFLMTIVIVFVVRESNQLILPLVEVLTAGTLVFFTGTLYRSLILDRQRAQIHKLFSHYLDPVVIDKMVDEGSTPKMGGETRLLTMLFSDIEGFSAISEETEPELLVKFLNAYFKTFERVIKTQDGIIDHFVGDALIAMYGAPIANEDHAASAVATALAANEALQPIGPAILGREVRTRFGINSGMMTVGNVGAESRVTYTAMGDGVNLAARLESANKQLGSMLLAGEETYNRCAEKFEWRGVNRVQVVGREQALDVYEPLCLKGELSEERAKARDSYAQALEVFWAGDFDKALSICEAPLLSNDPAAMLMKQRIIQGQAESIQRKGVLKLDEK
ncbi:MAG: adenylate/guanylate cyclase domain-containing protein [Halopseudomonas aestusnigri]